MTTISAPAHAAPRSSGPIRGTTVAIVVAGLLWTCVETWRLPYDFGSLPAALVTNAWFAMPYVAALAVAIRTSVPAEQVAWLVASGVLALGGPIVLHQTLHQHGDPLVVVVAGMVPIVQWVSGAALLALKVVIRGIRQ